MQMVAISPDGTQLAYPANGRIYVRSLDTLESRALPGSENVGINPVFAPDGQSLLLTGFSERGVVLRRLPIGGGAASTVATLEGIPWVTGVTWNRDGILVGGGELEILQIPLNGEKPKRIVEVASGEWVHGPQLLPDGDTVLFTMLSPVSRWDQGIRWDEAQVVAQSLKDGTRHRLVEGASDGRYLPTGHLVYFVGGTMYAVPFDADTLTVTGAAVAVVAGVRRGTSGINGFADAAISETGTLVYVPGPASLSAARNLVLSDGRGDAVPLKLPAADYSHPRVSPDALRLAVARTDGDATDIHTYDLSGTAALRRLTFGGENRFPVWSHDGRRVTFQSSREGDSALWWQAVEGGTAERLTRPAQGEEHVPEAWSPDGRYLLFSVVKASRFSLWVFRLDGKTSERFGAVESGESLSATFSLDGRWVAYAATDKARGSQSPNRGVFVEPFPATGDRHQAPKTLLDYHPRWAPDGRSIFYVPMVFSTIVSVPITTQPSVAFGTPIAVPHGPMPGLISYNVRGYDALRGGTFVSVRSVSGEDESGQAAEFRVVLNWHEELKRLVPTN
jgi:Tol biopolymer transport system component